MSGDTVECFNCGSSNPAWAQVCRQCGAPIVRSTAGGRSGGIFPTDQASLVSIGVAVVSIVLAIAAGLVFAGIVPPAPNVAEATPTPSATASISAAPSVSGGPSASGSASAAPSVVPLIGTITYGLGLNTATHEVTNPSDTFGPGTRFCYSILLTEPFGVSTLNEEVVRVESNGTETVVQARTKEQIDVTPGLKIAGYSVRTNGLVSVWGIGNFIMREFRGTQLIAEGRFTFTN